MSSMKPEEVDGEGNRYLLHNDSIDFPHRHSVWKKDTIKECEECGALYTEIECMNHECKD